MDFDAEKAITEPEIMGLDTSGVGRYGGNTYFDGIDSLGLDYNTYDLTGERLGLGYGYELMSDLSLGYY